MNKYIIIDFRGREVELEADGCDMRQVSVFATYRFYKRKITSYSKLKNLNKLHGKDKEKYEQVKYESNVNYRFTKDITVDEYEKLPDKDKKEYWAMKEKIHFRTIHGVLDIIEQEG